MIFFVIIIFPSLRAESVRSRVYEIDVSMEKGSPHLVKFENGRVAFIDWENKTALQAFQANLKAQETLVVDVDKFSNVQAMGKPFRPYIFKDERNISVVFSRMRRGWQEESQCYNRAHIWAYEEYKRTGLRSMKLFLFFTSQYIRKYKFEWWFHVAPMTLVNKNGKGHPKVLDARYTGGPRDLRTWTNVFIKSKRECPLIKMYSQYRKTKSTEDCYLIPASMYYWQPRDLDTFEKTHKEKSSFIQREVDYALKEAF